MLMHQSSGSQAYGGNSFREDETDLHRYRDVSDRGETAGAGKHPPLAGHPCTVRTQAGEGPASGSARINSLSLCSPTRAWVGSSTDNMPAIACS